MLLKAMIARKCFDFQLAQRTVAQLKALRNSISTLQQLELALEECSLLFTSVHTQTKALSLCRQVFEISKNSLVSAVSGPAREKAHRFHSKVSRLLGIWTGELRAESTSTVIDKYMDPAITTTANEDSKTSAHFALAKYMDSLYCTYYDRINSAEWYESHKPTKI